MKGKILIDNVNLQIQNKLSTNRNTSSFLLPDDWEIVEKRRYNSAAVDKVPVLF